MAIPTGGEVVWSYLPARDFELSKRFYEALGFIKTYDDEVAIFMVGPDSRQGFILQKAYEKAWADNCMMHCECEDVAAWWAHVQSLDLPTRFGVADPMPPEQEPWDHIVCYMWDPSGVLWTIGQPSPSEP
jgi:uncharacterized glyoxalase superfamily protein PhnB